MIKRIFLLISIVALSLPMVSCIKDDAAPAKTTTPASTQIDTIKAWQTDPNSWINQRLNIFQAWQTDPNSWINKKINTPSGTGEVSGQQMEELKARISSLEATNNQMTATIADLRAQLTGTSQGSTSDTILGLNNNTTGLITITPATQRLVNNAQQCYSVRFTNSSSKAQFIKPTVTLNTPLSMSVTNFNVSMSWSTYNMTSASCWTYSYSGYTNYLTAITRACGLNNLGEIPVPANGSIDVQVCIDIQPYVTTQQIWTATINCTSRNQ